MPGQDSWHHPSLDSPLHRPPGPPPAVPHRALMELLPLDVLPWPDFESIQWRLMRDVLGLRDPQMYGTPGQEQLGLDVIAQAVDGSGVALQSKRLKQFGPKKIEAAVNKFRDSTHPFDVSTFIIGVSREVRSDRSLKMLAKLRAEMLPVRLELWDQRELSMRLKNAPLIVIEYFGLDIAERFCTPFTIDAQKVPPQNVVAVQQALARTPEVTTGAGALLAEVERLEGEGQASAALEMLGQAQLALSEGGFDAHAAQHEGRRTSLLLALDRGVEASRRRLDDFWVAIDQGLMGQAQRARSDLEKIAQQTSDPTAARLLECADSALRLVANPAASLPRVEDTPGADASDNARLLILAGETALAADRFDWLSENAQSLLSAAAEVTEPKLRVCLQILAAEGTGDWVQVLGDARVARQGHDLAGLVNARYARHLALHHRFQEADAAWDEAAGAACLAQRWTDAANWTFSRRAFRVRWNPFTSDELLPLQASLKARGPAQTVLTRDEDALEYAYARRSDGGLRAAAIAAQRALRDAITLSDWEGERRARRLLADILGASEEPGLAAHHLVRAGEIKAIEALAEANNKVFLDVIEDLSATSYWIAGTAYRMIASQADLVPDEKVDDVVAPALVVLENARAGTLVDLIGFAGSRFLGAVGALAGLATRLNQAQAETALEFFEAQDDIDPGHYRYHDDSEALAIAGIAATQPALRARALEHLVALLARADGSRNASTLRPVTDFFEEARPYLEPLGAGSNAWARELMASQEPTAVEPLEAAQALDRLVRPLQHIEGVWSGGGGGQAVADSVVAMGQGAQERSAAIDQLLERADHPRVGSPERASYLVAASNLVDGLTDDVRATFLERALALVSQPSASLADAMNEQFSHPLGAMRMGRTQDARAQAAHLAATLARSPEEQAMVRDSVLALVGDESVNEYWVTRAFQRLGEALAADVGFLSGQGWALRSLAALQWVKTTRPAPVGGRLAVDPDVRVRRALATALSEVTQAAEETDQDLELARTAVLKILSADPCYSVRSLVAHESLAQPAD